MKDPARVRKAVVAAVVSLVGLVAALVNLDPNTAQTIGVIAGALLNPVLVFLIPNAS